MPTSSLPDPQPPHPHGPLAATEDVRDSAFLMRVLTESALSAAASTGRSRVGPPALPASCITDRLRVAWECAPTGGRRDALLSCAEQAVRAGVDVDDVMFDGDPDRLPPVEAIAYLVQGLLLAYVRDDLAAGSVPVRTLLPTAPWCPPVNASGRFASSTVDDFDQPEDAKMLVCVRLLATGHLFRGAATGPWVCG